MAFHLFRYSCLKWLPLTSLPTTKGRTAVQQEVCWSPSLAKLSASSFPSILQCLDIRIEVTLLGPFNFSSVYIHSPTKADSVVVLVSAAIDALLAEQMCILLFITFLDKRSSVHLRIAIISGRNIVEGLHIWIISPWLSPELQNKPHSDCYFHSQRYEKCFWLQNSEWQLLTNKIHKIIPCGKYLFIARTFTSVSWLIETLTHLSTELLTNIISTMIKQETKFSQRCWSYILT